MDTDLFPNGWDDFESFVDYVDGHDLAEIQEVTPAITFDPSLKKKGGREES